MNNEKINLETIAKESRDFYSMNELISAWYKTMKFLSWGPHAFKNYQNRILRFKVNAHRHQGHVYLNVNASDLFDVRLTTTRGTIVKEFKDIFIGELLDVIDQEIEFIEEYNY